MEILTQSWELKINISEYDLNDLTILVNGDLHIANLLVKLIEKLNSLNYRNDWSNFALWWPDKNAWLNKTKMTLDQVGVQADAVLFFTRIYKPIRLQLPDQQTVDLNLNFSVNVFNLVKQICKEFSIRHHEELSLLKADFDTTSNISLKQSNLKLRSKLDESSSLSSGTSTLNNSSSNSKKEKSSSENQSLSIDMENLNLTFSPIISTREYLKKNFYKYKTLFDKTKLNLKWLDSSKSLQEQNISQYDLIKLKFKYFSFYDLNLKYDLVRLNQIYEQSKWSILSEEIDCTEQELINFAALQLQIQLQTKQLQQLKQSNINSNNEILNLKEENNLIQDEDDVDTALNKLEKTLDLVDAHSKIESANLTPTNSDQKCNIQLEECLNLIQQSHKYTFRKIKKYYFILDDLNYLSYFKSKQDVNGKPLFKINLKSCEVVPDVNLANRKFGINLKVPSSEGMNELCLRCDTEESYANWMSAFKLASKSKLLTDQSYSIEVKSILNLLNIQNYKLFKGSNNNLSLTNTNNQKNSPFSYSSQSVNYTDTDTAEIEPNNLLPNRIVKKYKLKQLNDRILEAYSTISDLDINESKLRYIKEWQALPTYGISYFAVKIKGSKYKEELIGITSNRIMRISPEGDLLKSWRFNTMKSWNVNWDIKQFEILFDEEHLTFLCLNCACKILHEFIGGYIYLSLRQQNSKSTTGTITNDYLNEDMFFKLTEKR